MQQRRDPSLSVTAQAGFVMPLCLVVIALLALTAVTLMQSLVSATERAQLQKDMVDRDWAKHNVEQQIIWRATVEAAALSTRTDFSEISPAAAQLRVSAGAWDTRSNAIQWQGSHSTTDIAQGRYKVFVQDARGLLDLNYKDDDYVVFLTKVLGFSAGERILASNSLGEKIAQFEALTVLGDEEFRTKNITGMTRKEELCRLNGWSRHEICTSETELMRYATFGTGVLPNILVAPQLLKDRIGLRVSSDRISSSISEWEKVQRREGFYDPYQSSNGQGLRFHVWIDDDSYGTKSFFALELVLENGQRPFNISQRIDENVAVPSTNNE